jgi:hypothetical protein
MVAHLLHLLFERQPSSQIVDAPVNRNCRVHKKQRMLLGRDSQRGCQHDREGERTSDLEQVHEKACLTDYLLCNLLLCQRSVLTMPL